MGGEEYFKNQITPKKQKQALHEKLALHMGRG